MLSVDMKLRSRISPMNQKLNQYNVRRTTTGGLKNINSAFTKVADKFLKKRGFIESAVVYKWGSIIGEELSGWCYPTRLSFPRDKTLGATLYLDVLGARSVEVQHLQPIILDRINLIFGYTAVASISIRQVQSIKTQKLLEEDCRLLTPKEEKWILESVKETKSRELKNALETLGKAILAKK